MNISKYITYRYSLAIFFITILFLFNVFITLNYIKENNTLIKNKEIIENQKTSISKIFIDFSLYLNNYIDNDEIKEKYSISYSYYKDTVKKYKTIDESLSTELDNFYFYLNEIIYKKDKNTSKKLHITINSLIEKFELIIKRLEEIKNSNTEKYIKLLLFSILIIIITTIFEVIFIFKPMEKKITSFALELKEKNSELEIKSSELEFSLERLKDLQNNLQEDNAKINAILEASDASIWLIDNNFNLIYFNNVFFNNFLKYFGRKPNIGENVLNLSSSINWTDYYNKALKGKKINIENKIFFKEEYYYTEVIFTPIRLNDEIIGVATYSKDITEKKTFEEKLIKSKERAEELSKAKSTFLAIMSHEIRTPLNGIIGMTELLLNSNLNKEQRDFVETIKISGDTLLNIINDILDFSKFESGNIDLHKEEFNIHEIIEEVFDTLSFRANQKNIDLIYHIEENVPRIINNDRQRLKQVLFNLVGNSVKFTNKGEIFVSVSLLNKNEKNANILFKIKDTGIGIKEDIIPKLFNPFVQADSSTTRRYGGTGLGLSICKKIVESMDGSINVNSEFGKGSEFTFTINTEYSSKIIENNFYNLTENIKNRKIVIVDDNSTNLKVLSNQIKNLNLNCKTFESSLEALEFVKQNDDVSIVISDMQMPDLDGISLSSKIRNTIKGRDIIIGLLTSLIDINYNSYVQEGIINDYLYKPIKQLQLLDLLYKHLKIDNVIESQRKISVTLENNLADKFPAKILLAEDNLVNQKLANKIFEKLGYKIDIANNGLEAINKLKEKEYDIIFMDIQMPEMDGIEATKYIVSRYNSNSRPKIVAMTANAIKEDRDKAFEVGMDDYITKPISITKLQEVIKKYSKLRI